MMSGALSHRAIFGNQPNVLFDASNYSKGQNDALAIQKNRLMIDRAQMENTADQAFRAAAPGAIGGDQAALNAAIAADPDRGMALQTQLFTSRRAALQAELGMLRENSQGTQEQLKGLESLKQSREQQLSFVNEELKGVRDMAAQGYVPRNRMLQLERTVSEISGQLAENIANIGRTKNALSELKLRMLQRQKEYQKEVETQLTELQKETRAQADRLAALEYEMANTQIKSPIDGVVVGIVDSSERHTGLRCE